MSIFCAVGAAPASAAVSYVNVCPTLQTAFCTSHLAPGFNGGSVSIAVDNSTGPTAGDVWTILYNPFRLMQYGSSGDQLAEFKLESGSISLGSAGIPRQLAVDPGSGDIYLSSDREERAAKASSTVGEVTKLDPAGEVLWQITGSETPQGAFAFTEGVAVDPTTGDLYVSDSLREVLDEFTPEGKYIGQFPVSTQGRQMDALAFGPEGDLYLGLEGHEPEKGGKILTSQVRAYSSSGSPVDCPGATNVVYESPPDAAGGITRAAVAVDPSDGHLFISERSAAEKNYIAEYSVPCGEAAEAMGGGGELVHGGELGNGRNEIEEIGVNAATHSVYSSGKGLIFGLVPAPSVTTAASATRVTPFSATVSGTVSPEGTTVTECEFEYGGTLEYGHTVPCAQTLPLEGGPATVSATLTNLAPGFAYYYRLRAGTAAGHRIANHGTFTTESLSPPVVEGLPASGVTQFAATLHASLQTHEALVNYHFEYGTTTAYGQVAPVPDNYTPITTETVPVAQPIDGLQAGATYHYRLIASSAAGTDVYGPDETFTTLPIPAPGVQTGGATAVGVGSATLSGLVNPQGWNTSYTFEYGATAAYGSAWPTVLVDMGALEGPQPVVVTVPGLQPNTTYHYRLVAGSPGGTTYGQDMTFTTGEYPAQIIQEPPAAGTLLVPTEPVKTTKPSPKKKKKKRSKAKKKPKRRRARRAARSRQARTAR